VADFCTKLCHLKDTIQFTALVEKGIKRAGDMTDEYIELIPFFLFNEFLPWFLNIIRTNFRLQL
jgi:hypothetical protein